MTRANGTVPALDHLDEIHSRMAGKRLAICLDYDGTLSPIVPRPEDAVMSDEMRDVVRRLAARHTVAMVSGRDRRAVEDFVQLDNVYYAGSHGFDIKGPGGLEMQHEQGRAALPVLDAIEAELGERLEGVAGSQVERKRYAVAIHYRNVAEPDVATVERHVDEVHKAHPLLRKRGGKKVFELQPDIEWHKGKAVLWLLDALGLDGDDAVPMYVGDDLTDEDAFVAIADRGVTVYVGEAGTATAARYRVKDVPEVRRFLESLIDLPASG